MDLRFGLIFLLVVGATWGCDARRLTASVSDSQVSYLKQERNIGDSKICKLCENFVSRAVDYLSQNKTQTEITGILRGSCSVFGTFKKECINLVDTYAPMFFSEISSIESDHFCKTVHFCQQSTTISWKIEENGCGFCHQTVSKVLVKLKDPDTQIEIIEMLLKTCKSMAYHVKECKRLVLEYGPLILANSEKFLEETDICTVIHACAPSAGGESTSSVGTVPLHADS